MSVAVIKQQSTLADYGFRNLYETSKRPSREEQARNVRNYVDSRRKENYGLGEMTAPPKELGRDMMLFEGDDLEAYENAADIIQNEISRSGLESEFPDYLDENINVKKLPALRDYFSRQSTLPEHMWDMTTEGEHFDERGNIIPGAIPPVNAVKVIGGQDYRVRGSAPNVSMREGYGLTPNYGMNEDYEDSLRLGSPFIPLKQGVGFVSPPYQEDMNRHYAANVHEGADLYPGLFEHLDANPEARLVGIRGFGVPQDKAFARPAVGEGREGVFTNPIPPERLVGVFNPGKEEKDFPRIEDELKHLPNDGRIQDAISQRLPKIWEGRTFGLDNPAFSQAEKASIRAEIENRIKNREEFEGKNLFVAPDFKNPTREALVSGANRTLEGTFNPTKLYGFPKGGGVWHGF